MDDLDALLADLQSTTAHISSGQNSQNSSTQDSQTAEYSSVSVPNRQPSAEYSTVNVVNRLPQYQQAGANGDFNHTSDHKRKSADSFEEQPPPLPPPPAQDVLDSLKSPESQQMYEAQQPMYEAQQFHKRSPVEGSTPVQPVLSERRQPRPAMSTLSSNLSELDSLLQELNSSQFMAEVDKKNPGGTPATSTPAKQGPPTLPKPSRDNGNGRPIDALLDDLQKTAPSSGNNATYQQVGSRNEYSGSDIQASAATKDLDELMSSLEQFKVSGPAQQQGVRSESIANAQLSPSPGAQQSISSGAQQPVRSDQLDTMLGNLQTDMSRHGVTTVPKGHCAACNKPIVGQVITALGHTWHPEHFMCSHCHEELGTKNFFERDGRPYCEKDYHGLFSPRCAYCNGPILDKCVTALDRTWHQEHFFCAQCGKPFSDDGFHEKNGQAYCRDDYFEMFAPKCGGCSRPIMDNYISALNRQWHPECFVCGECHISFGGGSFFDHDGLPYCETHYHARRGSLCAGCQKPITGRCITAMYKKFHPEHFVCAFCLKQLNKGTFKEQNDKPYCHPCFVKLFG